MKKLYIAIILLFLANPVFAAGNAQFFPAQGIPYQYAYCDIVATSTGTCLEYSFIAATTSSTTTAVPIIPYGGVDFYEWVFGLCVIIALIAPVTWRMVLAPIKDMYVK